MTGHDMNRSCGLSGICLGHQGLAHMNGAKIVRLEDGPMHGRLSPVSHTGKGIFRGLPQGFEVSKEPHPITSTQLVLSPFP